MTEQGTVRFFHQQRNFGFIKADAGCEVFVSGKVATACGIADLNEGDRVQYGTETISGPAFQKAGCDARKAY